MNKSICIITGSRADYGLLKPLIKIMAVSDEVELFLVATGSHLSKEHGYTYSEILDDGFQVSDKVEILLSSDTTVGISKAMGLAMISFSELYTRLRPDAVVVLGDRYEIFSAVSAAHLGRIPVMHLSGGEVTQGVVDDAFRHSITKMSQLHFTATEEYRKRVIQLGENPKHVYNVGEIGLEDLDSFEYLNKMELSHELKISFDREILLVTYHPVTLEMRPSTEQLNNLFKVLEEQEDRQIIFTKSNADAEGAIINDMIDDFVSRNTENTISFDSLGRKKYLSLMKLSYAVIGNSSSGIVEAPCYQIGTINIGDRQKGRVRAKSIIDCQTETESIRAAFEKLDSNEFQQSLKNVENPYQRKVDRKGSEIIFETILSYLESEPDMKKPFFDLN